MKPLHPGPDPQESCREGFAYLEHTADIRLKAWAPTYPQVVAQALSGLATLIFPPFEVARATTRVVSICAPDPLSALVQSLNELLYLLDTEGFLLAHTTVKCAEGPPAPDSPISVTLSLEGDTVGAPGREYGVLTGVKAATYGGAALAFLLRDGLWEALITLDV